MVSEIYMKEMKEKLDNAVLILVLVDMVSEDNGDIRNAGVRGGVLILVLVDMVSETLDSLKDKHVSCLNPCFSGHGL